MGRRQEALKTYKEVIRLAPQSPGNEKMIEVARRRIDTIEGRAISKRKK